MERNTFPEIDNRNRLIRIPGIFEYHKFVFEVKKNFPNIRTTPTAINPSASKVGSKMTQ
jgi:hypothetical protein